MNETTKIIMVGVIVLITHCLEGITGFGCTVLALPFIIMLLGIKTAVPVLVILAWILAAYIIIRSWRHIRWQELLFIIIHVGIGLPVGMMIFDYLPARGLKAILALFMVAVGLHGLYKTLKTRQHIIAGSQSNTPTKSLIMRGVLFLGGIIHGAFGTGGPFVVIYASKALTDKTLFRVTLCLLWFTLNTVLIIQWLISGLIWEADIMRYTGWALPFLIGGMLLGDYLHHKVNEYYFKIMVYIILFGSGFVMGYSVLRN